MKEIFITATDTDAGKTFISCALIQALTQVQQNRANNASDCQITKVAAFKPISAGCDLIAGQLVNEDAKLLSQFANCSQSIAEINPITFKEPIAPHIAAKKQGRMITVAEINNDYQKIKSVNPDILIVEGAGGWRLPLGNMLNTSQSHDKQRHEFLSDFVKVAGHQVILIVNMKLGCLNHALLTYEAIKSDGVECIAWIANNASMDCMDNLSDNIIELEKLLPIPKIAQFDFMPDIDEKGNNIPFHQKINDAARQIDLSVFNL